MIYLWSMYFFWESKLELLEQLEHIRTLTHKWCKISIKKIFFLKKVQ